MTSSSHTAAELFGLAYIHHLHPCPAAHCPKTQPGQGQQRPEPERSLMAAAAVVKMPATFTAFTSRIGLPPRENDDDASKYDQAGSMTPKQATVSANGSIGGQPGSCSSGSSLGGSCAISFYSNKTAKDGDNDSDDDSNSNAIEDDSDWEEDDDEDDEDTDSGKPNTKYYDEHGQLIFNRVQVPRTRSLASNLSMLIHQAKAKEEAARSPVSSAASSLSSSSSSSSASSLQSSYHGSIGSNNGSRLHGPFATGRTSLPNPLRCHPGIPAAPLAHSDQMSPPSLPPVPPSSPCGSIPPPSGTASASLSDASTSSSSNSSSSTSSSSASDSSSSSSSSGSASASASAYPSPSRASSVLHMAQISSCGGQLHHRSVQSIVDSNGKTQLLMPFNGGYGPRAAPIVNYGAPKSKSQSRREIRFRSDLADSGFSCSLQQHILSENNSRYVFKHYGSSRYADDVGAVHCTEASASSLSSSGAALADAPPFRRTQSAPTIRWPMEEANTALRDAGKLGPVREIYYVDDYEDPKSWDWGMDYHSKGW